MSSLNRNSRNELSKRKSTVVEEYAWERSLENAWENVQEDEDGLLRAEMFRKKTRISHNDDKLSSIQRGMLRNVYIVLDMSQAMGRNDLKPNRANAVVNALSEFISEFFDQNPVSLLGIIISADSLSYHLTQLSGNPRNHMRALRDYLKKWSDQKEEFPRGDFSLQHGLTLACSSLSLQPAFATREVIVIHGSINTRDSYPLEETIGQLIKHKVRVSVISIPGELFIASRIANLTHGLYSVPLDHDGLRSTLLDHCRPAAMQSTEPPRLVKVGFPTLLQEEEAMCVCHEEVHARAYVCPECDSRYCEVPTQCAVCELQLLSAPSLARSYHHLFPVAQFVFVSSSGGQGVLKLDARAGNASADEDAADNTIQYIHDDSENCNSCMITLKDVDPRYVCPMCRLAFCEDCDALIHESIHNCPGCINN